MTKKNPRKQTFQESGVTIYPYTSLPTTGAKCKEHQYELKTDGDGHKFVQCHKCGKLK